MASEPANGGSQDDVKAETIQVFTNHETASIAAANLQAHGIHCWINADDGGGMLPNFTAPEGVRLLVRASDATAAIGLLTTQPSSADMPADNELEAATTTPPARTDTRKKFAPGQAFIGIVAGVLLCLFYQWYDQLGKKVHYHYTKDGKTDKAWVYQDGRLVEFLHDRNLDGAWDEWTYYEQGGVKRALVDNNFDGVPDETWTYSNGALVKMEKDTDFNGIPDEFCTYKYGVIQQVDIKPNGAKFATQRDLYQNGVLVEVLRGADGSGNFKETVRYDPFFNPISTNKPQWTTFAP